MFKRGKTAREPENFEKAYDYVIFLLSLRLRSEGEIRQKLSEKGYPPAVVEKVLGTLRDNHYVDDRRFAEIFLDNLKKYKNFGFYGIQKKLLEKRLPKELIENVLSEGLPPEEEYKLALRFLKKEKIKYDGGRLTLPEKQKAAQRLRMRGFKNDTISKLIF